MTTATNLKALDRLASAVADLQSVSFDTMAPADQLRYVRTVETLQRRVAHGVDRVTGLLDASAAFSLDGHRNVRNAVKHLGRLSGSEALGRTQTIRALQLLPDVEAAYRAGRIPVAHMRLIARVAANPRVHEHLDGADPIFAEQATTLDYDQFQTFVQQWLVLADPDGADRDDEISHEKRRVSLHRNFDGSWSHEGQFGPLQGATLEEILSYYEQAEFGADWAWARERFGDDACAADLPRTPAQRRADALVAMALAAASAPADGRRPEPCVSIVIDQETFEDELRRACGQDVERDPNVDVDGRVCHTINGTPLTHRRRQQRPVLRNAQSPQATRVHAGSERRRHLDHPPTRRPTDHPRHLSGHNRSDVHRRVTSATSSRPCGLCGHGMEIPGIG